MDIEFLPTEVVDQIAAGEVVERPAHMVKELVENSIDAGATSIQVTFDEGGRQVVVEDNGRGMSAESLPKAVARHATSKIRAAKDLWALNSFGFRGEALASISAVSKVEIVSKSTEAKKASQLKVDFGDVSEVLPAGGKTGTRIQIDSLYENTPARLKFLKSDTAESTQIKNTLKALALANPQIEFRIFHKGKLLQFWQKAETHLQRVEDVLDVKPLYSGEYQLEDMTARVFLSAPNNTIGYARQLWFFVQGRWVQDRRLQVALMDAYRNLLMHREFPYAAVFLDLDPTNVDVNIHPAKSQVKFKDEKNAFRVVQRACRSVLEGAPWLDQLLPQKPAMEEDIHFPTPQEAGEGEPSDPSPSLSAASVPAQRGLPTESFVALKTELPAASFKDPEFDRVQYKKPQLFSDIAPGVKNFAPVRDEKDIHPIDVPEEKRGYWSSLEVLGQANLTYIVAQSRKALVLVDQHAAHERIVFESLMQGWREGQMSVQDFLVPLTIPVEPTDLENLLNFKDELAKMGFDVDAAGPEHLNVRSAPALLKESKMVKAFEQLAKDLEEAGDSHAIEKTIGDICATLACHSVVRAGQALAPAQRVSLLSQMDLFPLSSFCPHGRPVYVEYPLTKIERDFGRLV